MKKNLILVILICLALTNFAYSQQYWPSVNHGHDTDSDGLMSQKKLLRETLTKKIPVLVITNHLSCLVGKCDAKDHHHPKRDFSQEYFGFGKPKQFKLYQEFQGSGIGKLNYTRDAEIFTNIDSAHILFLNLDPNITNRPELKELNWKTPQEIVDYIKTNNGISVLAHPHWMKEKTIPTGLDALEFFNTKGYNLTDGIGKFENAESIDLGIYCDLIKKHLTDPNNIQLPSITAGCDAHALPTELNFGHTYFWGKDPTVQNLYQAIKTGQTFAVMGSGFAIKIKKINYPPNKTVVNYVDTTVKITGELSIKVDASVPTGYIKLFRDGVEIDKKLIKLFGSKFTIDFTDNPPPGRHVYFLYSPVRFITSPIIVEVTASPTITPSPTILPPAGPEAISNRLPSISPDGQWVAFVNNQYGNNEIFIVNTSTLKIKRLTYNKANDTHPTWHPNSKEVLFQSDRWEEKNNILAVKIYDTIMLCRYTTSRQGDCTSPMVGPYNILCYFEDGKIKEMPMGYPVRYPSTFKWQSKINFRTKNNNIVAERNGEITNYTNNNYNNIMSGHIQNWLIYYTNRSGDYDVWFVREDAYVDQPIIVMPGDQKYTTGTFVGQETWLAFESNHDHLNDNPGLFDIYLYVCQTKQVKRLTFGRF